MIRFSLSKLIMEMVGTCLLTMFFSSGSSGVILLGLWILNVFFWKISGSHFNPAVTFAYMFRKDEKKMGWKIALAYMVAQFIGAYVGALLLNFYTFQLPQLTFTDDFIMRAIFQETLCTFIFVFFFMTNTDEKLAFSNEKAINCFILSASYVGARSMFAGNIAGISVQIDMPDIPGFDIPDVDISAGGVTTYGAVMNPAIALGICLASLFNLGFEAWQAVYLYPTVPFGAAFLSVLFYELIYKKTQAFLAQDDDHSDGDNSQDHDHVDHGVTHD
jgi:glycerol uptake facilitator-like aquaporin